MQTDKSILASLLSALLREELTENDIDILNPLELGKSFEDKDFILDLKVRLKDSKTVNVEMQLWPQSYWKERSMLYLCRMFDSLPKGRPYTEIGTAIHIGILNFCLPDMIPELYSENKMSNIHTHQIYTEKLQLNILTLPYINLAT